MSDDDPVILRTFIFQSFVAATITSMIFIIATLSITISLCDRKKKNTQVPGTPGTPAAKSMMKATTAVPVSVVKHPTSPTPGAGGNKHEQHLPTETPQKKVNTPANKSKADRKSQRGTSQKKLASLDKTQEESVKPQSAKSASKESGEKKDEAAAPPTKDTKDTEKKEEEEKKSEPPPIVPEEKVKVLGNLDEAIKEKKTQLQKEIEDMGSEHEHDKVEKEPLDPQKHVVINENKCKLYTTNNEETKEDDAPDDLI